MSRDKQTDICCGIHYIVRLAKCPRRLRNRVLHRLWCSVSSLKFHCLLVFLRPSSSCLRLLPRIPDLSNSPSLTCFRRQLLRVTFTFIPSIVHRMFLSRLTLCNTPSVYSRSVHLIVILLQHIWKILSCLTFTFRSAQFQHHKHCAPNAALCWFVP